MHVCDLTYWKYGAGLACTGAALYGLYLLKRRKLAA